MAIVNPAGFRRDKQMLHPKREVEPESSEMSAYGQERFYRIPGKSKTTTREFGP